MLKSNERMMRKAKWVFTLLTVALIATACSDSEISPNHISKNNKGNKPYIASSFDLVKITVNVSKDGHATASATSVSNPGTPPVAANIEKPSDNSSTHGTASGTIQTKAISVENFNSGKFGGSNGHRYFIATFAVQNADENGDAYTKPLNNLTFIAAHVNGSSIGQTAISDLQRFDGSPLPNPVAFVKQMIPTGLVGLTRLHKLETTGVDELQVYSENTVGNISVSNGVTLFPYGFTVLNKNNGSRTLPASPSANQYDGIYSFAFKMPLAGSFQGLRNAPYHFTFWFKPVVQSKTRITQAPEEQSKKGNEMLADHIKNDLGGISNVDKVVVFPGSRFWQYGEPKTMIKCTPTRVAGTANPLNIITPLLTPDQMKQVGAYPGDGNIGDAITIHGCDFTGSENVTVGSQPATVTSSDPTHLVVDIPDGVTIGQSYDVTVDRSGTPYSAGDVHVNSAIVGSNATVTTDITGVCLGCTISNPTNVIDTDANTFSNMSLVLGLLGAGGYIDVKYSAADFPAGNRPGFVIKKGGGLLDASVLGDITITTYLNGSPQETKSGAGVLSLDLLKGGSKQFIGFKATKKFDEVRFTVSGTVALGSDFDVYRAYANYND